MGNKSSSQVMSASSFELELDTFAFFCGDADRDRIFDRLKSRASALLLTKKSANKLKTGKRGFDRNFSTKSSFSILKSVSLAASDASKIRLYTTIRSMQEAKYLIDFSRYR